MPIYRSLLYACLAGFILLNAWQCSLGPGEGGSSAIEGRLIIQEINSGGIVVDQYYGADERVYLIYGTDSTYNNDFETSFDGSYEFTFLRKGDYTLFAYSDCNSCDGEIEPIFIQVNIEENGQVVTAPDLIVRKFQ